MLFTASTVKDSPAGLSEFVARNLAGGVDHCLLFVDDADPAVLEEFAAHPHVTAVPTGPAWWHGKRPKQLNVRQRINANVARALVAPLAGADWIFHVDGDEALVLDRGVVDALPAEIAVVRAAPLEAVSRVKWPGRKVTHFKRMLEHEELTLLQVLGLIEEPLNGHYFHGHCEGKCGMRPTLQRWHALHDVHDHEQELVPAGDDGKGDWARLLHYESWSGEEFVRKWMNILASGSKVSFRPVREPTAVALRALLARDLPEKKLRAYLMRIFERTTADDFETLLDLGLLEQVDPLAGTHRPEPLGPERAGQLAALLAGVGPENKWHFHTGRSAVEMLASLEATAARVEQAGEAALAARARELWTLPQAVLDDVAARQQPAGQAGQAGQADQGSA